MDHPSSFRALAVAAALVVSAGSIPISSARAATLTVAPGHDSTVTLTMADVTASNQKIAGAYKALVAMWSGQLARVGVRFAPPRIARYERSIMTSCGTIRANNAEYCADDNTIFFDDVFVAAVGKQAAVALGTDGDMAAIGIIAHEMGHAVAMQVGQVAGDSYGNESTADCLAGAFAQQSDHDGVLEKGDIEEAYYGMSMAGDPTPQPTGNARMDARIQRRIAQGSHGTQEQRMANFRSGLTGGPGACLAAFAHHGS